MSPRRLIPAALLAATVLTVAGAAVLGDRTRQVERVAAVSGPVIRILPMGDSITYGLGAERLGSYRVELDQRLTAAGVAVDMVGSEHSGPAGADRDNEGHSGWKIRQIAAKADEWMAAERPDVVLLQIGTNDMRSPQEAKGAPARLSALLDRLLEAGPAVEVYVAQLTGARDHFEKGAFQGRINAYNRAIRAVVDAKGRRVHLVDQSVVDETDLLDALHPNDFGYRKMAWTWFRALEPLLNTTGRAWPATNNPFRATTKYLREHTSAGNVGRWWYLRTVKVVRGDAATSAKRWQTRRAHTEKYRVKVKGHYVTRTRTVQRWSST